MIFIKVDLCDRRIHLDHHVPFFYIFFKDFIHIRRFVSAGKSALAGFNDERQASPFKKRKSLFYAKFCKSGKEEFAGWAIMPEQFMGVIFGIGYIATPSASDL